jgi:hypothetical protein
MKILIFLFLFCNMGGVMTSLEIFAGVEMTGYQKMRAIIATLNNVGMLAAGAYPNSHEVRALVAIDAAEALLEQLGIEDPDLVSQS